MENIVIILNEDNFVLFNINKMHVFVVLFTLPYPLYEQPDEHGGG